MASPSDASRPVALVTGITGFTGRYVREQLERDGYRVVGWTNSEREGSEAPALDLLDAQAVEQRVRALRPDVVLHLAAISFVAHSDAREIYDVNVVGTRNLLQALAGLDKTPSRVILASSANVYGNASGVLDETAAFAPANDYAVSKVAMELMARLWQDKLPITVVRPFNYTGVGQSERFLVPKIVAHFRRRAPVLELGNLDVARDFYDVRLVAQAYGALLSVDSAGQTYNICSGQEHELGDVVDTMKRISGHDLEVRVNPAFVRENEVKRLRGDNSKLISAIGALPEFSLEATLRWMYEA